MPATTKKTKTDAPTETVPGKGQIEKTAHEIDRELENSFPASDPPSYTGGKHIVGAPTERKTPKPAPQPDKK